MEQDKKLEEIVGFDELTSKVRDVPESPTFRLLKTSLHKVASDYYHSVNGDSEDSKTKELVLNETRARELAGKLWDTAAEHVAVNYLKLKADKIKELKEGKDPASGKSLWEAFIRDQLGIDKETLYDAIKTRGIVKPEEIESLIKPIYDAHASTVTTKIITSKIDSLEKAQALLNYIADLKNANPKTYEGVTVPKTIKSVEESQRLYASVIQLLSKDYKPNIAETVKKQEPVYKKQ